MKPHLTRSVPGDNTGWKIHAAIKHTVVNAFSRLGSPKPVLKRKRDGDDQKTVKKQKVVKVYPMAAWRSLVKARMGDHKGPAYPEGVEAPEEPEGVAQKREACKQSLREECGDSELVNDMYPKCGNCQQVGPKFNEALRWKRWKKKHYEPCLKAYDGKAAAAQAAAHEQDRQYTEIDQSTRDAQQNAFEGLAAQKTMLGLFMTTRGLKTLDKNDSAYRQLAPADQQQADYFQRSVLDFEAVYQRAKQVAF